jgi:hypothetical protein
VASPGFGQLARLPGFPVAFEPTHYARYSGGAAPDFHRLPLYVLLVVGHQGSRMIDNQ